MDYSSFDEFREIWDELSKDSRNCDIKNAISAWCYKLNLQQEQDLINANIFDFLDNKISVNNSFFNVYKKVLLLTHRELIGIEFITERTENIFDRLTEDSLKKISSNSRKEMESKTMTKEILLIAFVLVGVGLVLFYISQLQNRSSLSLPSSREAISKNAILILIINAQKSETLLNDLNDNKKITSQEYGEQLYRATTFLWAGSESDFEQSDLREWFNRSEVSNLSEYDIKLVKIELRESDSGFNKDTINRLPAFRRLHKISGNVEVSKRLPSKAYENSNLYK